MSKELTPLADVPKKSTKDGTQQSQRIDEINILNNTVGRETNDPRPLKTRWGDIRLRYEEIVNEAQLQDKSKNTILAAADDLVGPYQKALADSQDRLAAGEPLTGQAVLITWRDIRGINATLVVSRHRDLGILFNILSKEWEPQDDATLLVDVHLCGVGNYEKIADPKLGLDGKFFLDEPWARSEDAPNKLIPNAESLINRGDFLLGILCKHTEKKNTDESSLSRKLMKISTPAPFTISA
ncbi:hypothetical protein B0H13DRAFT_2651575 [Mycena leptocephala]|nr:hypothetical protein B0H13DRAFT_2651575 [Mycena leptocephala]